MEKTFFDVRVFNPHAPSNRNQTPSACMLQKAQEGKEMSIRTEDTQSGAFVLHSTCFFGHRRNRERSNLFLQTSWLPCSLRSGITHTAPHSAGWDANWPSPLFLLSHTIPTRRKIFSTSCCPLPSSNRPRHHWVPYHSRLLNPLFHLKFPFFLISFVQTLWVQLFILCSTSHSKLFSIFLFPKIESLELQ